MADITVTAANVVKGAGAVTAIATVNAGATIAAGQAIYTVTAAGNDGTPAVVDKAIDTSIAAAAATGIALSGGSAGQAIVIQTAGAITIGATVVKGGVYGVTDTAGGISLVSDRATGDYVTILGVALTISTLQLSINASGVAM
jgi:hypothetical protein